MNTKEKIEVAVVTLAVFAIGAAVMVGPMFLYVKGLI